MSTTNTEQQIAVMQASLQGKTIEFRRRHWVGGKPQTWVVNSDPKWNWESFEYRVQSQPREFWVNVYPDGMQIAHNNRACADAEADHSRTECVHVREVSDQ